jgi:hypothetical protein
MAFNQERFASTKGPGGPMHIARRAVVVVCVNFARAIFGDVLQ